MSKKETELVFYARVGNAAGLEQAQKTIYQEQVQIKAPNGRIRVRMEKSKGEEGYSYNLVTKRNFSKEGGVQVCDEPEAVTISAEAYEMFKSVNDEYMRKVRYVFPIESIKIEAPGLTGQIEVPGLCYEVDRFLTQDGAFSEWVKIDLEIDALHQAMEKAGISLDIEQHIVAKLSALPFDPQAAFHDDGSKGNAMRALVDKIYETQFLRRIAGQPEQTV